MASPSQPENSFQLREVMHQLVRIVHRGPSTSNSPSASTDSPQLLVLESPSTSTTVDVEPLEPLQRVASSSSSQSKKRLSVGDRLKRLGKDIGKLGQTSKSVPASPKVSQTEIEPVTVESNPGPAHARLLSVVAEAEETEVDAVSTTPGDPPEATSLAERIQALVDSLPFPSPGSKRIPISKPPTRDPDGRPIPPPSASPIKDSRLLSFLSSPAIMNGSTMKGRPSIWSVLESIGAPAHGFPPTQDDEHGEDQTPPTDDESMFSDNSSVMIYSPLIPGTEDLPELAELVPVGTQEELISELIPGTSWTAVWPLSIWYTEKVTHTPIDSQRMSGETVISPRRTSIDSSGRAVRVQTVRAWVPSNTKLSVQAMWWGYRLYLPPPVLAILSDKTLEATKRAAMITTALTWFFNNLPVTALPVPLQPAALLLQRLAPYLGYIGTFISWSWSTIRSYDIGYGVYLSATWLLPIALIPGTWHQNDFPTSPTQGITVPLPPTSPPPTSPSLSSTDPTSPTPTSPSLPSTTPGSPGTIPLPSSPMPTSTSALPSPITRPLSPVSIPIPPTSQDLPPVPPDLQHVPVNSPLSQQLLSGPLMTTIPLPDEDAPTPAYAKPKSKEIKSRAKALFARTSFKRNS